MKDIRTLTGGADQIWSQIASDFSSGGFHDYHVNLEYEGCHIELNISSSPGGSEEGGYENTTILSPLQNNGDFTFEIHPEDFLNKLGKLFGGQDIITGYPEFDDNLIVKTNNPEKLKHVLSDQSVRSVFQNLSGFTLHIDLHKEKQTDYLHLIMQRAVGDVNQLKQFIDAFIKVRRAIEA